MAVSRRIGGFLFKRSVKQLVEGAELEWRGDETLAIVDDIIEDTAKKGARIVARKAKEIVAAKAYETGDLYNSIKVEKSLFRYPLELGRPVTEFLIKAGDYKEVDDYAFHVETGRYYEETGSRVPAVPFMREAFSKSKRMIRQMFMNKLRQRLGN